MDVLRLLLLAALLAFASLAGTGGHLVSDAGGEMDPNGGSGAGSSSDGGCFIDPLGGCVAANIDKGMGVDPNG